MNVASVHKRILKDLRAKAGTADPGQMNDSYTGSTHRYYAVTVPERRAILKEIIKDHKKEAVADWLELVEGLITGKSHEEKTMGAYLLGYLPEARGEVEVDRLDSWLEHLVGWAEVDALCQNIFKAEELLGKWSQWQKFLIRLSKDTNINKRRASLVFLTAPTSKSNEERLHEQAYQTIDRLKSEKDILITKAISWLLRSMADSCPKDVRLYVNKNIDSLPKIAVRETKRKLTTGKKN